MSVLAIGTGQATLAIIGLVLGVVVLVLVANMLQAVLRPIQEIDRHGKRTLTAGVGIATNLDGVDQLERTHALGGALPGLAVALLTKLGVRR